MNFKQYLKEASGDEYDPGNSEDIKKILKDHLEIVEEWEEEFDDEDIKSMKAVREISKLNKLTNKFLKDFEMVWKQISKYQ